MLVGTKCHSTQEREVETEKAQALADHFDISYMEVSSEEDINIDELFETMTSNIIETFKRNPEVHFQNDRTFLLGKQDRRSEKEKCSC